MTDYNQSGQNGKTDQLRTPKRLILCFDGTGNTFQGNTGDTNIVKLLNMFERSSPDQMHYYQPGIGTYSDGPVNRNFTGRIKQSISHLVDQGFATTFDAHVIAGYRFLMRYYNTGDRIYIFGFSRGAFTARFLARLVSHVGLLSMGNEEMVPFAYKVYQDYAIGDDDEEGLEDEFKRKISVENDPTADGSTSKAPKRIDVQPESQKTKSELYMEAFRDAFCRHGKNNGIKIQFLGLFDTVSSVRALDAPFASTIKAPIVHGTAQIIRHAVATDERRVKFKAALLQQEGPAKGEDIQEVWFPGNHGDIGGGWLAEQEEESSDAEGLWKRIVKSFNSKRFVKPHTEKEEDKFQLSDIALKWMIHELDEADIKLNKPDPKLGGSEQKPKHYMSWNKNRKYFLEGFEENRGEAIRAYMHDTMRLGKGSSCGMTIWWNILEWLPIIRRWEYVKHEDKTATWQYVWRPLNKGDTRDIPHGGLLHQSVIERMALFPSYRPQNEIPFDSKTRLYDIVPHKINVVARESPFRGATESPVIEVTDSSVIVPYTDPFISHEDNTVGELTRSDRDRVFQLKPTEDPKDTESKTKKGSRWFWSICYTSVAVLISSLFAYRRL